MTKKINLFLRNVYLPDILLNFLHKFFSYNQVAAIWNASCYVYFTDGKLRHRKIKKLGKIYIASK